MQAIQIVRRSSHTERLFFMTAPDAATRSALRQAGWKYDRAGNWWRNRNSTAAIRSKELAALLAPLPAAVATA